MIPDDLINPYGHAQETEFPHRPVAVQGWTEHYFFFGYDPDAEIGMNVHIGRLPADTSLWRAVVQIYLPGGEDMLVAKYHGRDGDATGPGAGPVKLTCIEPFRTWTVEFDGAAFLTDRHVLTRELLRDGPAVPVRFSMLFEAAGPLIGRDEKVLEGIPSSSFHSEQVTHMRGQFSYRGTRIALKGMGVRDHSSGPRDYAGVVGDIWFHSLFPSGKIISAQVVRFEKFEFTSAYVFYGDGTPYLKAEVIEHPHVNSLDAKPASLAADPMAEEARNFRLVVQTERSREAVDVELLHSHAITYAAPMEEFIGTDLTRADGIQMCEAPARVRCNGETGYALRERVARTGTLFACSERKQQ